MNENKCNKIVHLRPHYLVTITANENEVRGKIEGNEYVFNPLNVLDDLSYAENKILLSDEKILASQYTYEYAFGERIKINDAKQYTQLVMCIKDLLKYVEELKPKDVLESKKFKNVLKLKYVEIIKTYYHIAFDFLPFEVIEPVYGSSPDYPPLFSFISIVDSTLKNCQSFKYACYFPADIICSILHFLAFNEYKICKCSHCGKYFATHSNKQKYCTRNSPYEKYTHLNCEQAVRNILQALGREHDKIRNNLNNNYMPDSLDEFLQASNDAKDKVKRNPTIENIQLWESVLDKSKWCKKEAIRTVGKKKVVQDASLK